jgi:hypothetical protein
VKTSLICVIFLCAVAAVCRAEERWALLVGIDQYADDAIRPMRGAVGDTVALRDVLLKHARFPSGNVFCLTSSDKASPPDLGNIIAKLDHIASKMKPGDVLLFFFAGQGVFQDGKSYLVPCKSDIRSTLLLSRTCLVVEELSTYLGKKIQSGKIILIVNVPRKSPTPSRKEEDNLLTDEFARAFRVPWGIAADRGIWLRAIIYSCKAREDAYSWPGKERTFFGVALEEALSGKADRDGDRKITLIEVDLYLAKRVQDLVKQELGVEKTQTPWVVRSGSQRPGDWVFSWVTGK